MAALRCAMSKLAGGRALLRLRTSLPASAPRSMSSAGASSIPPKHTPSSAAGCMSTNGDPVSTLAKQLEQKKEEIYKLLAQVRDDKSWLSRLRSSIIREHNKKLLEQLSVERPGLISTVIKHGLAVIGVVVLYTGYLQPPVSFVPRQVVVQDVASGGKAPKKTDLADNPLKP